jgi:glycosyltransferase involved in cell wall biosynthesis
LGLRRRVAFDVSSTRGQKTGIGTYTEGLIRALREFAPEIELVELDDGATARQRTDRRIAREQFTLPRLAARAGADILHLTGFGAPLRSRVPVVITAMDLIGVLFSRNFPLVARFYWSRYLPVTLRRARRLIAISEQTRRDLSRLAGVPGGRVRVIYPGRDESFRRLDGGPALEAARAQLRLPGRFFLFVGTLEPRKGWDTLVAAFSRIAALVAEDLVLVGRRGWGFEGLLAQLKRLGLESRIHLLDYVPQGQLPLVYNLARALVFPSRYEGFGLPPLEAMACGTPVIASNAASLSEVLDDAGVLVPPDDVAGFARAMLDLSRNDALHEDLRARGLQQAGQFSWRRAARETVALYDEMGNANHG